jgi:hypothetical protein
MEEHVMKKMLLMMSAMIMFLGMLIPSASYAASQDECAIWLCLPGGFPEGCGGAYSAFKKRLKNGKSPLPEFSSCAVSLDGTSSSGRYQMGVEQFEACPIGHMVIDRFSYSLNQQARHCLAQRCVDQNPNAVTLLNQGFETNPICPISYAAMRAQQHYIEMWVDQKYLGKFFYQ